MNCNVQTRIGEQFLEVPFYNASGVLCVNNNDLDKLYECKYTGAVVTKSCTLKYRSGNPEPRYWCGKYGSINSSGLPNNGFDYYAKWMIDKNTKPVFLSTSPMNKTELNIIANKIRDLDYIKNPEFNLSCPNVINKPQIGYSFDDMKNTLQMITEILGEKKFGVKLPPYFDPIHFDYASDILSYYNTLSYITCSNSIGNGLLINTETEETRIRPKNGLGGIGGKYCLPVALSNIFQFNERLPNIDIVGCGGIYNGEDVFQHILAGASAVQVGTCLYENGISIFNKLHNELIDLMTKKGYKCLNEFKGKIKVI